MINENDKVLNELSMDNLEDVAGGVVLLSAGTNQYIGAASKEAYCRNKKCMCKMKGESVRINGANISVYKCPNPRCMYYNVEKSTNEVDWK